MALALDSLFLVEGSWWELDHDDIIKPRMLRHPATVGRKVTRTQSQLPWMCPSQSGGPPFGARHHRKAAVVQCRKERARAFRLQAQAQGQRMKIFSPYGTVCIHVPHISHISIPCVPRVNGIIPMICSKDQRWVISLRCSPFCSFSLSSII
jgi:hypothetical protein